MKKFFIGFVIAHVIGLAAQAEETKCEVQIPVYFQSPAMFTEIGLSLLDKGYKFAGPMRKDLSKYKDNIFALAYIGRGDSRDDAAADCVGYIKVYKKIAKNTPAVLVWKSRSEGVYCHLGGRRGADQLQEAVNDLQSCDSL